MDRENAGKLKIENQEPPHSPVYLPSNDILKGPTYSLPNDVTVLTLIERQAVRVPNKTALIFGEQRLSFKALNEKSNRLAATLQEYEGWQTNVKNSPKTAVKD